MTELLRLIVTTGAVKGARPVSLILISEPGTGKTELLERFMPNAGLSFHSDLTWRPLMKVLRNATRLRVSHLVLTEFQKLFQRRSHVADNCLGAIVQAMEEGLYSVGVGDEVQYAGVRVGIIGAVTHGTMQKRREYLGEIGFLSRAFVVPWEPPADEVQEILRRITHGDKSDLEPIVVRTFDAPVEVDIPVRVGDSIRSYVWNKYGSHSLRPLIRFRALTSAAALLRSRAARINPKLKATPADWATVQSFSHYWDEVITE